MNPRESRISRVVILGTSERHSIKSSGKMGIDNFNDSRFCNGSDENGMSMRVADTSQMNENVLKRGERDRGTLLLRVGR